MESKDELSGSAWAILGALDLGARLVRCADGWAYSANGWCDSVAADQEVIDYLLRENALEETDDALHLSQTGRNLIVGKSKSLAAQFTALHRCRLVYESIFEAVPSKTAKGK